MNDCIFCKIIAGEIPSKKVYEDELVYSFADINPQAPAHILVVPKKHISGVNDLTSEDEANRGPRIGVIAKLVKELGVDESGYRIVVNSAKTASRAFPTCIFTYWADGCLPGLRAKKIKTLKTSGYPYAVAHIRAAAFMRSQNAFMIKNGPRLLQRGPVYHGRS
jgi:histidine triad (HIT) family protein